MIIVKNSKFRRYNVKNKYKIKYDEIKLNFKIKIQIKY